MQVGDHIRITQNQEFEDFAIAHVQGNDVYVESLFEPERYMRLLVMRGKLVVPGVPDANVEAIETLRGIKPQRVYQIYGEITRLGADAVLISTITLDVAPLDKFKVALRAGADVNAIGRAGQTALMRASWNGDLDFMKYLLEHGADVNIRDDKGNTALIMVARNIPEAAFAQLLIDHGAELDLVGDGGTALSWASGLGALEFVQTLLKAGANPSTALGAASQGGHLNVVQELLRAGAKVNAANEDGRTALMSAAVSAALNKTHTNAAVAQELIRAGADVNASDESGDTALMDASEYGDIEIVRALLAYGANVNAVNEDGETALTKASEIGNIEIADLLRANGAQ